MKLQGIYPAVLTPFAENGALDLNRFARQVDRLYAAGVDGIFAGGNAGEWYLLTMDERKALASAAVELSRGRGKAIVHAGCARLADTIELVRHAESIGADAVGALPPYLAKFTLAEVRCWYERIGEATGLPLFVYYFPTLTGGASGEALFDALRSVRAIAGYKFTDMNLFDLGVLVGQGMTVLNGWDPNLKASLLMGAHGAIGSFFNVAASDAVGVYRACRAGDVEAAERHQAALNRVIRIVRKTRLVPGLKFISGLQGFDMGPMREPALPLSADEQKMVAKEIEGILCAA